VADLSQPLADFMQLITGLACLPQSFLELTFYRGGQAATPNLRNNHARQN
jgi:hypothetical protein